MIEYVLGQHFHGNPHAHTQKQTFADLDWNKLPRNKSAKSYRRQLGYRGVGSLSIPRKDTKGRMAE